MMEEPGVRNRKVGVRSQESGARNRKTEVRSHKSGVTVKSGKTIAGFIIAALVIGIALAGCGGSGGDGGNPTPTPTSGGINNLIGVGVVMESRSAKTVNSIGGQPTSPAWKAIDLTPGGFGGPTAMVVRTTSIDISGKVALIILAWDKVNGANHYQVTYQGTKVWDSATVDTSKDPAFQADKPQAYLDLDDNNELGGKITTAGQYEFQVTALSDSAAVAQSPVTASLGTILQSLPKISYTNPTLSWTAVTGANVYRINITGINPVTVNSNTTTYDIRTLLSASIPVKQYNVYLDARTLDSNGRPVEIARGVGGLSY